MNTPARIFNGRLFGNRRPQARGRPGFSRLPYLMITIASLSLLIVSLIVGRDVTEPAANVVAASVLVLTMGAMIQLTMHFASRQVEADQRMNDQQRAEYESMVNVLLAALDLQDNVASAQARRVAELASVIGWQIGLRKEQVREIEKTALLHDVGKIGVADSLLAKAGPLEEVEWAEMRRHPEFGHEVLGHFPDLQSVAEVILSHHERFDGTGYPRGHAGQEIPLGARIFAIADAYNAMTSHRPYRKPLPHEQAVAEISRNAGTQFDPEIVQAFLLAEKKGLIQSANKDRDGDEDWPFVSRNARPRSRAAAAPEIYRIDSS